MVLPPWRAVRFTEPTEADASHIRRTRRHSQSVDAVPSSPASCPPLKHHTVQGLPCTGRSRLLELLRQQESHTIHESRQLSRNLGNQRSLFWCVLVSGLGVSPCRVAWGSPVLHPQRLPHFMWASIAVPARLGHDLLKAPDPAEWIRGSLAFAMSCHSQRHPLPSTAQSRLVTPERLPSSLISRNRSTRYQSNLRRRPIAEGGVDGYRGPEVIRGNIEMRGGTFQKQSVKDIQGRENKIWGLQ